MLNEHQEQQDMLPEIPQSAKESKQQIGQSMSEYEKIDNSLEVGQVYIIPGAGEQKREQALYYAKNASLGEGETWQSFDEEDRAEGRAESYRERLNSKYERQRSDIMSEKYDDEMSIWIVDEDTVIFDMDWNYTRKEVVENIMAGRFVSKEVYERNQSRYDESTVTPEVLRGKPANDASPELPQSIIDISRELPQSPKELHKEIKQSMSELKLLHRDCYEQWNLWRKVKEELMDCVLEKENLSQRAKWSIEAFQKQIHFYRESQMPANINYRTQDAFRPPEENALPVPQVETFTDKTASNKLFNFLQPQRETLRLQGELKLVINNTNVMRNYVNSLNKNIFEIKSEISQMREHNTQTRREIASGKPISDWIRMNLSAETKALGLDPEKVTGQDLVKALCRYVPEPQHMQEDAFEMMEQ